jgi:hypothetical protein
MHRIRETNFLGTLKFHFGFFCIVIYIGCLHGSCLIFLWSEKKYKDVKDYANFTH